MLCTLDTVMINVHIYTVQMEDTYGYFFLFRLHHMACGFLSPQTGMEPWLTLLMCTVLTTVPPSLNIYFFLSFLFLWPFS